MPAAIPKQIREFLAITTFSIIAISIVFYPAVFQEQLIYQNAEAGSDSLDLNITRRYLAAQSLLKYGEFPLWEPKIGCGTPLFAESEAGILHPAFLFFFLNNLTWANNLTILSAILIAMLGSYTWCRCLGLEPLPSTAAALAYGLSETFLLRTSVLNILHVICLLPISLALIHLIFTKRSKYYAFLLTCVWTFQLTASHFHMAAVCLICCFLYCIFLYCTTNDIKSRYKSITIQLFAAMLFAVLLGMIQILPTYELTVNSIRTADQSLEQLASGSPTWRMLKIFINPFYPSWPGEITQHTPREKLSLYAYDTFHYIGFLPLLLCFNTINKRRSSIAIGLWILAVFFFLTAMGPKYGIYTILFKYFPFIRYFHVTGRFAVPMICIMAALAAIGAQNLNDWIKTRYNARLASILLYSIIIITCVDLAYVNSQIQGYLPANWHTPPLVLEKLGDHQRIYSPYNYFSWQVDISAVDKDKYLQTAYWRHRSLLSPGIAPIWNIYAPDDYVCYGLGIVLYEAYVRQISIYSLMQPIMRLNVVNAVKTDVPLNHNTICQLNDWLRLMGVTHLITPMPLSDVYPKELFKSAERIAIPEIPNAAVFVYTLANPTKTIRLVPALQTKLPENSLDLEKVLYNANHEVNEIASLFDSRLYEPNFSQPADIGTVELQKNTNHTIVLNTSCAENAYLVISSTFDSNWKATVDGQPVPIKLTNLFMQSLEIPQGKHHVEMHYISPAFELGRKISLAALIIFLSAAVLTGSAPKCFSLLRRKTTAEL